ncbi:hypothetical protein K432DRAFT_381917 [Lepidopterella palustris CBS 459.81]|uniref:Uncharacterized protein n=1 Tax=Lepidopterella palustris CBS 459.81 TaxID=1314670 RepID=A0A8E2JFR4_9PEZI|nr:hypothetical protein K432DRAFT_381917 [Lepidopterella palustris CBS 459.81]
MPFLVTILTHTFPSLALSALSAYGLYISYLCISKLRQYEERSEKAAKWSNTAADQLYKTRATQTSAAVAVLVSFVTSTALGFGSVGPGFVGTVLRIGNVIAVVAAMVHVKGFWDGKAKVPFVEGYNEAIESTEELIMVLGYLAAGWGGFVLVGLLMG